MVYSYMQWLKKIISKKVPLQHTGYSSSFRTQDTLEKGDLQLSFKNFKKTTVFAIPWFSNLQRLLHPITSKPMYLTKPWYFSRTLKYFASKQGLSVVDLFLFCCKNWHCFSKLSYHSYWKYGFHQLIVCMAVLASLLPCFGLQTLVPLLNNDLFDDWWSKTNDMVHGHF